MVTLARVKPCESGKKEERKEGNRSRRFSHNAFAFLRFIPRVVLNSDGRNYAENRINILKRGTTA